MSPIETFSHEYLWSTMIIYCFTRSFNKYLLSVVTVLGNETIAEKKCTQKQNVLRQLLTSWCGTVPGSFWVLCVHRTHPLFSYQTIAKTLLTHCSLGAIDFHFFRMLFKAQKILGCHDLQPSFGLNYSICVVWSMAASYPYFNFSHLNTGQTH